MANQKMDIGIEQLKKIAGEKGVQTVNEIGKFYPDMKKYILEFAYGEIYARPLLENKQKMLLTITALTVLGGCEDQLTFHIEAALSQGLSFEEIMAAITHCLPYAGFPRCLNAISTVQQIYNNSNPDLASRG